jgi:CheY-like chemotaxis protein
LFSCQSFEFVEARDGEEALALLKRGVKPSMIILDYTLPKINGIELLRRIDSDHRDLILPVYGQRNLVYHASESQLAS